MERTAIVTGAGSPRGIGRAICETLARKGWTPAVFDINEQGADATVAYLKSQGYGSARAYQCNVGSRSDVERAVAAVQAEMPPVGALVNNAGITAPTRFTEISDDEFARIFQVNVVGAFMITQAVTRVMQRNGFGRIVSISSVSAKRGGGIFGGVHYSASKAAVLGLTRAVAREMGGSNITCNAVAPGLIDTDITGGALSEQKRREIEAGIPLGRIGLASEVGAAVAFLCSDEASYITGEVMDVNGGSHID